MIKKLKYLFQDYKKRYKIKSFYQIWQEGFHPQLIRNNKMMIQKINYIHYNPVKKGLVEEAVNWEYSSAKDYHSEEKGLIKIDKIF